MKTFKAFFLLLFASALVLSVNSCKGGSDEEELGPHTEEPNVERFKEKISVPGAQILDFRSAEDFAAGHIPGAINIPATAKNTASNDGEFAKAVLAKFDRSRPVYMYGGMVLDKIVAGRISKIGFGQANSVLLVGGFNAWKNAGFDIETGK